MSWRCLMLVKPEWFGYDDMLSRFHLIPERYGQTDGRTDRQNCYNQYRMSVCWRAIKMENDLTGWDAWKWKLAKQTYNTTRSVFKVHTELRPHSIIPTSYKPGRKPGRKPAANMLKTGFSAFHFFITRTNQRTCCGSKTRFAARIMECGLLKKWMDLDWVCVLFTFHVF